MGRYRTRRARAPRGVIAKIEQCPEAREDHWRPIAAAVAEGYRPKL